MSNQVDHYEREPRDRWHPEFDSFTDWLDTEAPEKPGNVKAHNQPRHFPARGVTLGELVER